MFQFQVVGERCDIIDEAVRRYYQIIFYPGDAGRIPLSYPPPPTPIQEHPQFRAFLDSVEIDLKQPCEYLPSADMLESYNIKIDTADNPLKATITSDSVWGILRGMETLSQLVYSSAETGVAYQMNATEITDFPRFSYRGFMMDTARHYMPLKTIKKMTDLLAQNKMNVLHWHLTDDASFPYESTLFPNISRYGSFQPFSHIYTANDVREVIEYARLRGIRVIPEFDSPDHTQSWGRGQPRLLTECYDDNGILKVPDEYGAIMPTREENYVFLQQFFGEIFNTFPDPYVHMGGDEVSYYCWQRHPEIKAFMAANGWGEDYTKLEQYYFDRLTTVTQEITQNQMRYIVWQELLDLNITLPTGTIVEVWKGDYEGLSFNEELARVTKYGYQTILASPWYLNYISYGLDWEKYYLAEPLDFNGSEAQKNLVIGGEATMWSEYVDSVSVIPRTWPRACTVAERLWSDRSVNDTALAALRLEEHRCRLLRRGFMVDPSNGVNFCEQEWDM